MSQSERILLVDDEANIRLTLGAMLTRAGYDVTTASGGAEAIALLDEQAFDLLIIDLKMPGVDGMQVVTAARARHPDVPIIILTGHGSLETAVEGLRQGIFDYLLKNTEPAKVIERVQAALQAHAAEQRRRALLNAVEAAVQELRGSVAATAETPPAPQTERTIVIGQLQLDTWRQVAHAWRAGRWRLRRPSFACSSAWRNTRARCFPTVSWSNAPRGTMPAISKAGELIKPHIHHLRQKLEPDPSSPRYILNVRGKGYLLAINNE
jgi:DNA-binding response OmpR family regulator